MCWFYALFPKSSCIQNETVGGLIRTIIWKSLWHFFTFFHLIKHTFKLMQKYAILTFCYINSLFLLRIIYCLTLPGLCFAINPKYQLSYSYWWKDMDILKELLAWTGTSDCYQRHYFCSHGSRSKDTVSWSAAKSRLCSCYVWRWSQWLWGEYRKYIVVSLSLLTWRFRYIRQCDEIAACFNTERVKRILTQNFKSKTISFPLLNIFPSFPAVSVYYFLITFSLSYVLVYFTMLYHLHRLCSVKLCVWIVGDLKRKWSWSSSWYS